MVWCGGTLAPGVPQPLSVLFLGHWTCNVSFPFVKQLPQSTDGERLSPQNMQHCDSTKFGASRFVPGVGAGGEKGLHSRLHIYMSAAQLQDTHLCPSNHSNLEKSQSLPPPRDVFKCIHELRPLVMGIFQQPPILAPLHPTHSKGQSVLSQG